MAPTTPSEADVIFNRANVALAKSQRLIASWLPPRAPGEVTKTEEELEKEDMEASVSDPAVLGLGAPLPKDYTDGPLPRRKLASDDKLLKQLLGKKATKAGTAQPPPMHNLGPKNTERKQFRAPARQEESDEEEGGRASSFQSRKAKLLQKTAPITATDAGSEQSDEDERPAKVARTQSRPTTSKRPANFLDEMLAKRSKKQKKQQQQPESDKASEHQPTTSPQTEEAQPSEAKDQTPKADPSKTEEEEHQPQQQQQKESEPTDSHIAQPDRNDGDSGAAKKKKKKNKNKKKKKKRKNQEDGQANGLPIE